MASLLGKDDFLNLYMEIAVYLLVSIMGGCFFLLNKRYLFIFFEALVITSFFGFLPPISLQNDFVLVVCLLLLCLNVRRKGVLNIKDDFVGKCILFVLSYTFVIFVYTVLQRKETLFYAFSVWRQLSFLLCYFIFRLCDERDFKYGFRYIIVASFIAGIAYYLQFLGIGILVVGRDLDGRFANIPMFTVPIIFYYLYEQKKIDNRWFWVCFYLLMLFLCLTRGWIIAFCLANIVFLCQNSLYFKAIRKYLFPMLIAVAISYPFLSDRFGGDSSSGTHSTISEIENIGNIVTDYNSYLYGGGDTFSFRLALAMERIEFLSKDLNRFLWGIGCIHEDSPNNDFNFLICADKYDKSGMVIKQQIENADIILIPRLLRYGFVFALIQIGLIFALYKRFRVFRDNNFSYQYLGLCTVLFSIFKSPVGDDFALFKLMYIELLLAGVVYHSYMNLNSNIADIRTSI